MYFSAQIVTPELKSGSHFNVPENLKLPIPKL
jgi:hypothetical protein